jgi:N6-L-threonylcarbamoyladenine synthase
MVNKLVLGIETSCDETGAAILKKTGDKIEILSNKIASSAQLQAKYGGVIPEQAAREQLKSIIPVINEAIQESGVKITDIDAIAVTYGPGLIGSLLVGVETAKTLSLTWNKPLIPINHLLGHFYANWITTSNKHQPPKFPCLGLLVSGGHTDLVLFKGHGDYKYLGGTRDDAAGECFDKSARLLGISYPGGPQLSKLAAQGDPKTYKLPRPMISSDDSDFSFSGLKTAVSNLVSSNQSITNNPSSVTNLAASIEKAIIDVLITKTLKAAKIYNVKNIMIAGGVAANQKLRIELAKKFEDDSYHFYFPPLNLCTDNAAMVSSAAFFQKNLKQPLSLQVNPNLTF